MLNQNILPMYTPLINCYTSFSSVLSIISDNDNYLPWFHSEFNNWFFHREIQVLHYCEHVLESCPWLFTNILTKGSEAIFRANSIESIMNVIDTNQYIFLDLDRFYIPESKQFKRYHLTHGALIFGYDRIEKTIHLADNLVNGKYTKVKCPFELFVEACSHAISSDPIFILKKRKHIFDFENFHITNVINEIQEYLCSKPSHRSWYVGNNAAYGISAYDEILTILSNTEHTNKPIDLRNFYFIWEHKKCMLFRLQFMNCESSKQYEDIVRDALILRNLCIKYNLTFQLGLLKRIYNLLIEIKEKEIIILTDLTLGHARQTNKTPSG